MITLLQLEYFRKLAVTEHITRTARELYISQTALSSMIIGLEKELGIELFDRSRRTIQLNEAGKIYLQYVNDLFTMLENGQAALDDLKATMEKSLSVAMGSSLVWGPVMQGFRKKHPNCKIKQSNLSLPELRKAIDTSTVDFVIAGADDIDQAGCGYEKIKDDRIYLCVPQGHHFANRESVYMRELKDEPFISLSSGTPWRQFCDKLFEQAGFSVKPMIECDYTMRSGLVEAEFGVALTTELAKTVDLLKPNRYVRIADEFARREMGLFWNPKKYLSSAAMDFKEYCTSYFSRQTEE